MSALICGSLAYDTIMVFPERFGDHIMPEKVHMLSVAFLVPEMRREFGGVAGNIAYNLHMLGSTAYPMATVGQDFAPYRRHLDDLGISRRYVKELDDHYTAQAFITTDIEDNQIAAFHPGAMEKSYLNEVKNTENIDIGIVGPDSKTAMQQHSAQFAEMNIPHIFDPGQAMPMFQGEDLSTFIDKADYVIVNDYESHLLQERTGLNEKQVAEQVRAYIITRGGEGSTIYSQNGMETVEPVKAEQVLDPTGCGDAYRAGLIHGLLHDRDLATSCRIGSLLGALKIAHRGPQNHKIGMPEFHDRFKSAFGYSLD